MKQTVNVSQYNVRTGELELLAQYEDATIGSAMKHFMQDFSDPKAFRLDNWCVYAKDYPNWEHLCFHYDVGREHESRTKIIVPRDETELAEL